ncbi:hypothetical protein Tco_0894025 [Tanacetum coccineum]|uniref:Uncharacterized protein n=1 Tax=Tanacetum coccineum TaxID=301880 RepID=A0ABQ5CDR1_9ASTR
MYTMGTHDDEAGSSRSKRSKQHETVEEDVLNRMGCDGEIDDMLRIRLREAESNEEIFTSVAWIISMKQFMQSFATSFTRLMNLMKLVLTMNCKTRRSSSLDLTPKWVCECGLVDCEVDEEEGACTQKESHICCGQFISKIAGKSRVLTDDVVSSLSAPIYYRDLDTTPLRDLIDSEGRLNPEDPQPGVPRVGIPRPPRVSMQDLYDRMGRMEICQEAIERMEYRQSYH